MRIAVTDADYERAMARDFIDGKARWAEIKQRARQLAAERMLDVNSKRQKELIAQNKTLLSGSAAGIARWRANEDELTRLFEEHGRLLDVAYPTAPDRETPASPHRDATPEQGGGDD